MPARPAAAAGLILVAATIGWLAARLLLLRTDLFGERPLLVGLSMVLGVSVLGYAGMLGVAFRTLTPWLLWSVLGSVGGVLLFLNKRASSERAEPRDREHGAVVEATGHLWPALRVIAVVLAVGVIALVFIHAVLGPVQEWDSVVYHAESARQWFMARPDPPVLFGPSVGIQISSNYPPLFPAAGAAIYTLIGAFEDLYLRLLSPICLVAIVLMTFGYARARFGARAAYMAVLLTLGAPLLILYGTWPTGYVLLAALLLGVVILADGAAQTGATGAWVGVGAVAGLAMLSQFYGFIALPIGIVAALAFRRRRGLAIVAFVATAMVVAGPWLVRNLVELGDPIYPLGAPFFHGRGLIEPIWEASKDEIRLNALGYWPESSGLSLRWAQLGTALFDRHLIAPGFLFALITGAGIWRRDRRMLYLAVALGGIVFVPLLPGWFWIRALVPAVPVAAILTGQMFSTAITGARRVSASLLQRSLVRSSVGFAVGVTLLIGLLVTVPLAVSGPNQDTWTTALSDRVDLMRSVRNLGANDLSSGPRLPAICRCGSGSMNMKGKGGSPHSRSGPTTWKTLPTSSSSMARTPHPCSACTIPARSCDSSAGEPYSSLHSRVGPSTVRPGTRSLNSCLSSGSWVRGHSLRSLHSPLSGPNSRASSSMWDLRRGVRSSAFIPGQTTLILLSARRCSRSPLGESTRGYSYPRPRVAPPLSRSNTRHPIQVSSSFICSMRCVTDGTSAHFEPSGVGRRVGTRR